ncbi:uncharacterized protein LOC123500172 isoform X1 [Portunus trituberculatus]|uniref:uncharacterized protein LOC123500172 isoform X1 n=1 Tax=Portunus trituberculatus TaxID=210409 RepID=UPI001E1D0A94|nr:uncharacterized protein LOC123500172 isoform X1 [Portunus trituberculatus]
MESSSVAQTPRGVWGSVCGWLGESLREHRPWPVLQLPIDERGRGNTDTDLRRDATPQQHQQQLENVQKKTCRVILGPAYTNYDDVLTTASLSKLSARDREALEKLGRGLLRHHAYATCS